MADSIIFSVAPYHIVSYGTLLGASVFHSFINGPVMYKSIDRPSFSAAQQNLFPIYFGLQTALPVALALTFPGSTLAGVSSSVGGLLDVSSRWDSLLPIATMFVTGVVNLTVLLPATVKTMKERRGQCKRDGKEWDAPGPHSDKMKELNKRFGMLHGISSLINLVTVLSAVGYGFTLGGRMQSLADRVG
ncbi:mitochondrial outer membrane protein [Ophiocordyceps camponoti-floridani]|uniref:Mitochondrial outer membrane protein n=1 Tax=Ophiocordyceps camponoti-floridani TaxID=2030778 RepID=A0A8H4Q6S7_9HYPO|nr:mitochondrial outer membrane protein [Ophiocordyceps camponoti-floridani]